MTLVLCYSFKFPVRLGSDLGALERMPVYSELNHPRLKIAFRYLFFQDSSPTKKHRGHLAKQVATVLSLCKRLSF
jgi:hypothetical protein